MKFFIKVKLRAKEEGVEKINENHFEIYVKEPPIRGKANEAVVRSFAKYLGVAPSEIKIVSGRKSRNKTFLVK